MRDVTVRGAGVFGLAVGFACLERGARVRVIDPGGPGGGASGGIVGALAPHTPDGWNEKKAFQFACLAEAEARWARVAAASGKRTGYARTGRLQPLPTERALEIAKARAEDAALNWGAEFQWEIREAPGPEGWAPPSPTGAWLYDSLSARIHPRWACEALAAAISALGGSVVREGADRGAVVHATGWEGLLALSEALGRPIGGGVKGQAVLLRAEAPEGLPQIFAEGLHVVPHNDGTVALGSTSERHFDQAQRTDGRTDELVARVREWLPGLRRAEVVERWAGVRPRAATRAPLVGRWPGREGHFIANGGFKIGFGIAWGVADLVADLVMEDLDRVPDAFRMETMIEQT